MTNEQVSEVMQALYCTVELKRELEPEGKVFKLQEDLCNPTLAYVHELVTVTEKK